MLRRGWVFLVAGLASVAVLVAPACGSQEAKRPPALDAGQVVDFWVGPADDAGNVYHAEGALVAVVDAYNQASVSGFDTETTPDIEATLQMKTGETICLAFSSLFPPDHVLVLIERPPQTATESGPPPPAAGAVYELKAPGLLEAVLTLAGDRLPGGESLAPSAD